MYTKDQQTSTRWYLYILLLNYVELICGYSRLVETIHMKENVISSKYRKKKWNKVG